MDVDYFVSDECKADMESAIEAERKKVLEIVESKDILKATSYSLAMLSFHSNVLSKFGVKETAIKVLKDALSQARKGV
jgi:hypothetical protein